MTFTDWLSDEMHKRGWSQAELAREAEITKGALSHIFSGTRKPGVLMLKSIARAFNLPEEHVFRVAGILEAASGPQKVTDLDVWVSIFVEADLETRQHLLAVARSIQDGRANPHQ
jgi:transcriptional regulator with XRE-family HTH domain